MEVGHAARGFVEGLALGRGELSGGLLQAGFGDAQLLRGELGAVELLGVGEHGGIAAVTDVGDDARDGGADVGRGFAIADEGTEAGEKVGGVGREDGHGLSGSGR